MAKIELNVTYTAGSRAVEVSGLPGFSGAVRLPARAWALADLAAHRVAEALQAPHSPAHFMAAVLRTLLDQGWLDEADGPVYSGPRSREFWARVNAVPGDAGSELYGLGCELQNLEARVLEAVGRAEERAAEDER